MTETINPEGMNEAKVLEQVVHLSANVSHFKEKCETLRKLMDEGTYKIETVLNIIEGLKTREHNILTAGGDPEVARQMNEEQVESLLEIMKSPAFQSLARQLLMKMASETGERKDPTML